MWTDIGMPGDNVAFAIFSQIPEHTGFYVLEIDFCRIPECECIFLLQERLD